MSQNPPRISVVIPVHNSASTIHKCLDSLLRLNHPSFEVIVLDDGSTDATPRICESYSAVKVVRLEKGGPARARNVGIDLAAGEFIALTDGDCVVDPGWLEELQKGFVSPEIAGVGGDQRSPEDETETGKRIQEFLKLIGFMGSYLKRHAVMRQTEHNPSCNVMYRKSVLVEAGGFDESLWPGEDVELDLRIKRLGYKLIYNPDASVAHYRPATHRGFARMFFRYGEAQGWLVRRHGAFRKIHYVPMVVVAAILVLVVLLAVNPWLALTACLPWPLLLAWFYLSASSLTKSLQFTGLFILTLVSWNAGFFKGLVEGRPVRYKLSGACDPPG